MSNEKEHYDLLEKWSKNYEENRFTDDGPVHWETWEKQKPKIMFLLKEAYGDGDATIWNPNFSSNILRWTFALKVMYSDINMKVDFPSNDFFSNYNDSIYKEQIKDIAFVEVKKLDTGKSKTDNKEIREYARKDKEFLKDQIRLIDPHVIFCGYTFDSYKIIYDDEPDMPELNYAWDTKDEIRIRSHKSRMIIEFYHPTLIGKSPKKLFELLCRVMQERKEGNVFENFDW